MGQGGTNLNDIRNVPLSHSSLLSVISGQHRHEKADDGRPGKEFMLFHIYFPSFGLRYGILRSKSKLVAAMNAVEALSHFAFHDFIRTVSGAVASIEGRLSVLLQFLRGVQDRADIRVRKSAPFLHMEPADYVVRISSVYFPVSSQNIDNAAVRAPREEDAASPVADDDAHLMGKCIRVKSPIPLHPKIVNRLSELKAD